MNRSGTPLRPAITPHASSGWSFRACAMILSASSFEMVSMLRKLPEGPDQAVLQVGQPVVGDVRRVARVVLRHLLQLLVDLLGHLQAGAEGEPDVVERA